MARRKIRHRATPTGRPVIPQGTDVDNQAVMLMPDGRAMAKTVWALTEEQVDQIRHGYTCVKCLENLDSPFPDECPVCKFPMRERQSEEFAKDFRGGIPFGPSTTLEEEMDIMDELRERQTRERMIELGIEIPRPSIIVPRGI